MNKNAKISIRRQCELLGLTRSGLYYKPVNETEMNLKLMNMIDAYHTEIPFYGSRRMTEYLRHQGYDVNRKRTQRLMAKMGIEAIYPKKDLSKRHPEHRVFPYLLREVDICRRDQVWSTDITYIRMARGFLYLVAIMDWYSRYVLSWRLSNTLDTCFCLEALDEALAGYGPPEIFNSDQGCQFTSVEFTGRVLKAGVQISMDGRGRAFDNIFIERLWRAVKYEEVYLHDYEDGLEAKSRLGWYFDFYNFERYHQSLEYQTPAIVYGKTNSIGQGLLSA